jgi:hypothetical protein
VSTAVTEQETAPDAPETSSDKRSNGPVVTFLIAFVLYSGLSVLLWWHAWSSHPTAVAACACNDPSLFTWFLEWPAYAIAHGHNPFYSSALFFPKGINLLSNTGVLTLGIPLAPVTWLFGPVATLNVASTLGPALSALSMFWLLSRWTRWAPAAFVGGLVFGFSPFALVNLAVAHLNTEILLLVPVMVACLDQIFVRQRRRPVLVGGALGLLIVLQFFLSTEILAIVFTCAVPAIAILVVFAVIRRPAELAERALYALRCLAATAAVTIVLLAYPVWFALEGPAHLSGLVWPTILPGTGGVNLGDIWNLHFMSAAGVRLFAGYEGPALPQGAYLGIGMVVILAAGIVVFWREKLLWLFGGLAVMSVAFSLSVTDSYWVPWRVLAHIPLVQNVTAARFYAVTTLCVAILLGIVVDRSHDLVIGLFHHSIAPAAVIAATVTALAVAAIAAVPMATAVATNIPFTTVSIEQPAWFAAVAPHLPTGQVVLAFPPPVAGGSALTWQAVDSLHFAMATGAGPGGILARAGIESAGLNVITEASVVLSPQPPATAANVQAVRQALAGWQVTLLVVPDPSRLFPRYDRSGSTAWALGFFTLAIGRPPAFQHDAWVWDDVQNLSPRLSATPRVFARCTAEQVYRNGPSQAVPGCVVAGSRRA